MDWNKEIKDLKFRLTLLGLAVLLLYVVFFGVLAVSSALPAWLIGLVVTAAVAAAVYLIATNLY